MPIRPDIGFRSRLMVALAWSAFPGVFLGMALGIAYARSHGWAGSTGLALGAVLVVAFTALFATVALLIAESGGWAAGRMAHPTGVPYRFDHSAARALLVRGQVDEAAAAFEAAVVTHPTDPAPRLELARLHRDLRGQPDVALRWFRRAREAEQLTTGEARVVMREILELARKQLGDPMRAAPDLALHAERWAGSDEGEWAARELAELKAEMKAGGRD